MFMSRVDFLPSHFHAIPHFLTGNEGYRPEDTVVYVGLEHVRGPIKVESLANIQTSRSTFVIHAASLTLALSSLIPQHHHQHSLQLGFVLYTKDELNHSIHRTLIRTKQTIYDEVGGMENGLKIILFCFLWSMIDRPRSGGLQNTDIFHTIIYYRIMKTRSDRGG